MPNEGLNLSSVLTKRFDGEYLFKLVVVDGVVLDLSSGPWALGPFGRDT
jgi:hypothetical protein